MLSFWCLRMSRSAAFRKAASSVSALCAGALQRLGLAIVPLVALWAAVWWAID